MSKGTRYTWTVALSALALGWGELVAYEDLAPHAKTLLASDRSRAVLKAGEVLARNVSALVVERAQQAAGTIVLRALKGTSQLYRLALGEPGETGTPLIEDRCAKAAEARVNPVRFRNVLRVRRAGASDAAAWNADPGLGAGCPACPRCPAASAPKGAASAGAHPDWAGVARALAIIKV